MDNSAKIIVLSGNVKLIEEQLQRISGSSSCEATVVDEKLISRFGEMRRIVRAGPEHNTMCFGCKDLLLQRYQFVLKSYLFLSNSSLRLIVDEQGRYLRFNAALYFLIDVPKFIYELILSAGVVVLTLLRLFFFRRLVEKK